MSNNIENIEVIENEGVDTPGSNEVDDSTEAVETNTDGKVYTEDEVTEIVAERFGRLKANAVKAAAEQMNEELTSKLSAKEVELAEANRKIQAMTLSNSTGVSVSTLLKTGLSGEALDDFAKELENEKKSWTGQASKLVSDSANNKSGGDWLSIAAATLAGGNKND